MSPSMGGRIYVSEHKRFMDSVGFDYARAKGRLDNALAWYQGTPNDANLKLILEAGEKINEILDQIARHHWQFDPPSQAPSSVTDKDGD